MKKNIRRALSLILIAAMLFAMSACTQTILVRFVDKNGDDIQIGSVLPASNSNTQTPSGETPASQTPASETPASETPASQTPAGETPASQTPASETPASQTPAGETPASQTPASETPASQTPASETPASQTPAANTNALPQDNAGILTLYTELVNTFKASSPGYTKLEYQDMPKEYRNFGSVANMILGIAEGMITTKDKATPDVHAQGDANTRNLPIMNNSKGCLLTDASKIKTASCTDNGDGTATIKITLVDETNPLPAPDDATSTANYTSAMFMPMSTSGIEDIKSKFASVATVNKLDLVYTDCTVTAVFNTSTKKISSLVYSMPVDIQANAKVVFSTIDGSARIIDTIEVSNISY